MYYMADRYIHTLFALITCINNSKLNEQEMPAAALFSFTVINCQKYYLLP